MAANRIFGILEELEFKKEKFGTKELKNFEGNIEFRDVYFSYEDDIPILKGLNLKIVKMDSTFDEIKQACHLACLDDFIESLPDKYETIVREGGVTLSGGQKQRLAIARALLLKTEILLFDEATSALDNETQTKIQKAISNLKGEYTILIIAHRLSTVIDSDRIYVIDDGKVEAVGNHKYLIENSKVYNKLYSKEIEEV